MSDESAKETKVSATVDAVTGLLKAAPVYQDVVQPSAQQVGKGLETVTKAVLIGLAPLKMLVWGYEQIEEYLNKRVSEKLKNVKPENIITPAPQIAGPAVEALRYAGHEGNLRELYANLLATAMDKDTAINAHPGYVEVIKNLTPDEALLLKVFISKPMIPVIDVKAFANDERNFQIVVKNYSNIDKEVNLVNPSLLAEYLDNLRRLGLIEIPFDRSMAEKNTYEPLENNADLDEAKRIVQEELQKKVGFQRKHAALTSFGRLFIQNVVKEKS